MSAVASRSFSNMTVLAPHKTDSRDTTILMQSSAENRAGVMEEIIRSTLNPDNPVSQPILESLGCERLVGDEDRIDPEKMLLKLAELAANGEVVFDVNDRNENKALLEMFAVHQNARESGDWGQIQKSLEEILNRNFGPEMSELNALAGGKDLFTPYGVVRLTDLGVKVLPYVVSTQPGDISTKYRLLVVEDMQPQSYEASVALPNSTGQGLNRQNGVNRNPRRKNHTTTVALAIAGIAFAAYSMLSQHDSHTASPESVGGDTGPTATLPTKVPDTVTLGMESQNGPEGGPVLTLTPDIVTPTAIPTEKPLTQEEIAWAENAGLNIQNLLSSGQLNRDGLKGNVYFIAEEGRADNPKLLEDVIKLMKLASSGTQINLSELKEPIIISKLFTPLSLEGVTLNKVALEQFEKEGCMILVSFDSLDHRVDDIDPDLYVKVGRYGPDNKWDYRGGVRNIVFGFKGGDASSFIKTWDELTIPKVEGVEGSEELWLTPDLAPKDRFDEIRLQNAKLIIVIPPNVDFKTFVRENIPPKDDTTLFTLNFMTIIKSDQMSDD